MFKKTAILTGICLAMSGAAQADYQWEAGLGYATGDIDIGLGEKPDQDTYAAFGSVYLQPIDTSKGPLGEAAFINRASSLDLAFSDTEIDTKVGDFDGQSYSISGRYVTEPSGWLFDLGYIRSEPHNLDIDTYTIGIGKYIFDATTLVVNYANSDLGGEDTNSYSLDMAHLWSWSNGSLKAEGSYGFVDVDDADDIDTHNVGLTYYPTNNIGLGGSWATVDGGGEELDQWSVFAEWFINEQAALTLGYVEGETDETNLESDAVTISGLVRF